MLKNLDCTLNHADTGQAGELRTISPLDKILTQLTLDGIPSSSKKVLFRGEGTGGIASYVAGWIAGQGMSAIVLDGANRFNPYVISSVARKARIFPERLLKRIRIARAFTCYQMATLMSEKLPSYLQREGMNFPTRKPYVILLGPITTFLDEDVPEREVRPLFERALSKVEEMAAKGVPFFLFQSPVSPGSKRAYLMKRLSQFSDLVWEIDLDEQEARMVLEKRSELKTSLQIVNCLPAGRQAK